MIIEVYEDKLKTLRDGRDIVDFSNETGLLGQELLNAFLEEYAKEKAEEEIFKMVLARAMIENAIRR